MIASSMAERFKYLSFGKKRKKKKTNYRSLKIFDLETWKIFITNVKGGGAQALVVRPLTKKITQKKSHVKRLMYILFPQSERMWSEDKVENPPFYDYQKVTK